MIACVRCNYKNSDEFIQVHEQCENCGRCIMTEKYFKYIGTKEDSEKYGGLWSGTPNIGEVYEGCCTLFCPNDTTVESLASSYSLEWELITDYKNKLGNNG